jgi:membrane-associated phospholipid phosphatase
MLLLVLLLIATTAGFLSAAVAWRYPRSMPGAALAEPVAAAVGEMAVEHRRLRAFVQRRRDPVAATGLALTVALGAVVLGGLVIGVLAFLVRANRSALDLDTGPARWGFEHATDFSTTWLNRITDLGDGTVVLVLAVLLAIAETIRLRSRFVIPFILAVTLGNHVVTVLVKDLADRARPTLNPIAQTLGPSFPSGHSSTAASFYACAALLIGCRRGHVARTVLAGLAVAIPVAVGCTRVLLDVHWTSDVIAGLALGWAWFAVCAIAFGGRLLRFGASTERATDAARAATPAATAVEV